MLERAAESLIAAVDLIDAQSHRLKDTAVETARDAARSAAVAGGLALGFIGAVLIGGLALVVAGTWALATVTSIPIAIAAAGAACLLVGIVGLSVQAAASGATSGATSGAASGASSGSNPKEDTPQHADPSKTQPTRDGRRDDVHDTRISHATEPPSDRDARPAPPHSAREPKAAARPNGRRAFGGPRPVTPIDDHRGQGEAPRSQPATTAPGPARG